MAGEATIPGPPGPKDRFGPEALQALDRVSERMAAHRRRVEFAEELDDLHSIRAEVLGSLELEELPPELREVEGRIREIDYYIETGEFKEEEQIN